MRIRFNLKKYSDTSIFLWCNEVIGAKILKEFYKNVHQPQLNRGWDGFLLKTILKTLFRLSRLLLDLQKYILSGTIKFVSVRSSQGNFSLFEITRTSVFFPEHFRCNLMQYGSDNFSDSSFLHHFESENFWFPFFCEKQPNRGSKI